MPSNPPMLSSGPREPKRAASIPAKVKTAVLLMVHGDPEDETCRSIGLVEAAKLTGLQPDQFRRWLDRSQVRAFLRAERKVALEAMSASNPAALLRVRDKSANGMVTVRAAEAIEAMRAAEDGGHLGGLDQPALGVTIKKIQPPSS